MNKDSLQFAFEQANHTHRPIIHGWLAQNYVQEWLNGTSLQWRVEDLDKSFQGSSEFRHWVGLEQAAPFSYLLTYPIDQHTSSEYSKWLSTESLAITLDVIIGDLRYLGKGICPLMIREFLSKHYPSIHQVFAEPDCRNHRAIHVFEKAGFEQLDIFTPKHNPVSHRLMRLELK
jgi:RimJ/RimL family protein N-acetyltransferase